MRFSVSGDLCPIGISHPDAVGEDLAHDLRLALILLCPRRWGVSAAITITLFSMTKTNVASTSATVLAEVEVALPKQSKWSDPMKVVDLQPVTDASGTKYLQSPPISGEADQFFYVCWQNTSATKENKRPNAELGVIYQDAGGEWENVPTKIAGLWNAGTEEQKSWAGNAAAEDIRYIVTMEDGCGCLYQQQPRLPAELAESGQGPSIFD